MWLLFFIDKNTQCLCKSRCGKKWKRMYKFVSKFSSNYIFKPFMESLVGIVIRFFLKHFIRNLFFTQRLHINCFKVLLEQWIASTIKSDVFLLVIVIKPHNYNTLDKFNFLQILFIFLSSLSGVVWLVWHNIFSSSLCLFIDFSYLCLKSFILLNFKMTGLPWYLCFSLYLFALL